MSQNIGVTKKKRETNFSAKEEHKLIILVKKYSHIIENKKTDSDMNCKKKSAWKLLAKEFNCGSGETFRSEECLKNKYLNLKKNSKKKFADEKRHLYGTGGGPPVKFTDSEVDTEIRELIGSQITGFQSFFDNDAPEAEEEEHMSLEPNFEESITFCIENEDNQDIEYLDLDENKENTSSTSTKDWTKQSVDHLRTPISKNLYVPISNARKRDNDLKTKIGEWAKSKQDVLSIKQNGLLEEQKQKMKQSEEKHQEEMKEMKEKHELDMLMKKEVHEIKLSILKLEKQKLLKELSN